MLERPGRENNLQQFAMTLENSTPQISQSSPTISPSRLKAVQDDGQEMGSSKHLTFVCVNSLVAIARFR
jgi:hypothetical protein